MLGAISQRAKHYLLFYKYVPDMINRRTAFRPGHLALANEFAAKGQLIWGGAYQNPIDGGELMFEGETEDVVKDFVKKDPYVAGGLVTEHHYREVMIVAGSLLNKK
jgi:hypothetical protein